jgi:hypothetical protein
MVAGLAPSGSASGAAGRRHQGARSRAAMEQPHGAAMDLWQGAGGALGPLLPPGKTSRIRQFGFPTLWWWDVAKAAKTGGRQQ